jgi:ATP-dependent DNA helicase RecG
LDRIKQWSLGSMNLYWQLCELINAGMVFIVHAFAEILDQSEGKTLEFKRDLSSSTPLLRTLTAFANSAGGRLVVGVDDDRNVIGVDDPLDAEERLCSLVADTIAPRLVPNIELITIENKTLLVAEVFLSGMRPHYLKREGLENGVYVRLGSTNRQADPQLVTELQRGVAGVSFDCMPMPDLDLDALDLAAIEKDFGDKGAGEAKLRSLRLLVQDQGRLVPSRGAVLLYGKDRRMHFDDAWVQCGRFIGNDKADIFDHIDIDEPLPASVDSIMLFLKKHAMRAVDFSEIRRKDIWSIPVNILREVVINALVHADYSHQGTPTRIAFFDNRIEVESPGLLLPGLTVDDMKKGVSQIRNPVIARVFRELDLVEQWGSGIPGIFREAAANKLPEPQIEEIAGRVRFTVPLPKCLPLAPEQSRKTTSNLQADRGAIGRAQSGAQSGAQSDRIILALSDSPLSAQELTKVLGLEGKTGAFKRAIKELLEQGIIEYTIPEKPTSRLQKYRIATK